MRFTVQHLNHNDAARSKGEWAILLDHEHMLFVGNYRQCEAWLDAHDIVDTASTAATKEAPSAGGTTWSSRTIGRLRHMANWCRPRWIARTLRPLTMTNAAPQHQDLPKHVQPPSKMKTFLRSEAGYCHAADLIVAAGFVGTVYFGALLLTLNLAWEGAVQYGRQQQTPHQLSATKYATGHSQSTSDSGTLDLVCDLESSDQ